MSIHTEILEIRCGNCPLKAKCHSSGEIDMPACGLLGSMNGKKDDLTVYLITQFKAMELYKWNRSKYMGYDIGWEKTLEEWRSEGYDVDFSRAKKEVSGDNFVRVYERMEEIHGERVGKQELVLANRH